MRHPLRVDPNHGGDLLLTHVIVLKLNLRIRMACPHVSQALCDSGDLRPGLYSLREHSIPTTSPGTSSPPFSSVSRPWTTRSFRYYSLVRLVYRISARGKLFLHDAA